MASRISFGFTLPQRGVFFGIASWPEMLKLAQDAERSGAFDSIWVGDSVMAKPRPESIALLGALSAATERMKLGVGCMASFPIRDPIVFAYQWATLDLISNGRMWLAACTGIVAGGVSAREGGIWGISDGQRGNRMAENIEICRRLWSEDNVTFRGKVSKLRGRHDFSASDPETVSDLDRGESTTDGRRSADAAGRENRRRLDDGATVSENVRGQLGAPFRGVACRGPRPRKLRQHRVPQHQYQSRSRCRTRGIEALSRRVLRSRSSRPRWSHRGPRRARPSNAPSICATSRMMAPRRSRCASHRGIRKASLSAS